MLSRLKLSVDFEIKYMKTIMALMGSMDTIIQAAQSDSITPESSTYDIIPEPSTNKTDLIQTNGRIVVRG